MSQQGGPPIVLMALGLVGVGIAGGWLFLQKKLRGGGGKGKKPWRSIPPHHGAFVERFRVEPPPHPPPPAAPLPLGGKTFAAKDIFDVEGHVTGFGNPTWAATHAPATQTAQCLKDVIKEGGTLEGTTHMDDMAYSMLGISSLRGQPVNALVPDHVPGGSSSGSAVAVAAKLVDFALGTDTAGSVRIPAANCGILGYRPTHGAVSTKGVVPMAPSLDTVGVFARDPATLRQVAHILLRLPFMNQKAPQRIVLADDLFALSACPRPPVTESIINITERCLGSGVKYIKVGDFLSRHVRSLSAFSSPAAASDPLQALAEAQRLLQRLEFRDNHGAWVALHAPQLHEHVAERVRQAAAGVTVTSAPAPAATESGSSNASAAAEPKETAGTPGPQQSTAEIVETEEEKRLRAAALRVKEELKHALNEELKNDSVLVLPAVPDLPPRVDAPLKQLDEYRAKAMKIVALGSMSGLPQVVLPVGRDLTRSSARGLPLSVSLMARAGSDRFLLDAACLFAAALPDAYAEVLATKILRTPQEQDGGGQGSQGGPGGSSRGGGAQGAAGASSSSRNGQGPKSAAEAAKDNGNAAFREKNYDTAVEYYTEAIRLDPRNPTYYANRAMAYLNLKNMPAVDQDCSAALELDTKNVKALLRRGTAREFMGLYHEAYQDFSAALVLEPTNKTAVEGLRRLEQAGVL